MHLDLASLDAQQVYATLTQTIIPRPVAWVLSDNGDGTLNLAPFSYFAALASDPPTVVLSIGLKPDGTPKDTRVNIEARHHFVIHIAHRELAGAMTASSATMAHGVAEHEQLGLPLVDMPDWPVPRLAECRVAYACERRDISLIGKQAIVMAELTHLYLDDTVIGEDAKGRLKVLAERVDPLGRLGGGEYFTAGEVINVPRPA